MAKIVAEPNIIGFGRAHIHDYTEKEFRDSLFRAFRQDPKASIILDDNMSGQKFLATSVAWAIDQGLLYNSENCPDDPDYPQQIVSSFRLTEKGKKEILDPH